MPDDDLPGVIHLAVLDDLGDAAAVVTLTPSQPSFAVRRPAYGLRQMAVRPDRAPHGLDSALFAAAVSTQRSRGVATLWAEARDSSVDFYVKTGMHVVFGRHHIVGNIAYTDMTIAERAPTACLTIPRRAGASQHELHADRYGARSHGGRRSVLAFGPRTASA